MWKVRWGVGRMGYTVSPGLYAMGLPDDGSEVLVTANYRMTFDLLRGCLKDLNVWILVLDTKGINVWCAAGKGTFGTDELVRCVDASGVGKIVSHRRLILPQLGAPGVAAHEVQKRTGFKVVYGPVESRDIPSFLEGGLRATAAMREKRFPLGERAALVPMELVPSLKWVAVIALAMALFGGIAGRGSFLRDFAGYGLISALFLSLGTAAGAVLVPLLLPWLPGRAFAVKGALTGAAAAFLVPVLRSLSNLEVASWSLIIIGLSSFLAMNFTGSSTFTSLSGVEREMRRAVPFQIAATATGLVLWTVTIFSGSGGPL